MTLRALLLGTALLCPTLVIGQAPPNARECGQTSTIPFAKVAMRRLCSLADKPEVRQATGAVDAMTLLGAAPPDVMWRIPDKDLLAFVSAFGESLAVVPDSLCADIYPHPGAAPWNQRFMVVAEAIDSGMAERWSDFLEAWVWAVVHKAPLRPEASPAEAVAHIRAQSASLSLRERQDMGRLLRGEPLPAQAACHVVRLTFQHYTMGPPDKAATTLRALMRGRAPWFVAT